MRFSPPQTSKQRKREKEELGENQPLFLVNRGDLSDPIHTIINKQRKEKVVWALLPQTPDKSQRARQASA